MNKIITKTDEIFQLSAPFDNKFQGPAKRVLFVCSAGLLRSATAANYFAQEGWNTRCCGSEGYALIPISANLIHWAHEIYFMAKENLYSTEDKFKGQVDLVKLLKQKSKVLGIPDNFTYGSPDLIELLKKAVKA